MKFSDRLLVSGLCLVLGTAPLQALESDRQEPLDVRADSTDGTLGDGMTTLRGNIEIRQGTLLVRAEVAVVSKSEGRVQAIELTGSPVYLEQEIENEGMVTAEAAQIDYEVASGIVTMTGAADVQHPQYEISGEKLIYDMNVQHFQGAGGEENGRIQIRLDPEVLEESDIGEGDSGPDEPPAPGESG